MNLTEICRTFHLTTTEDIFFSHVHRFMSPRHVTCKVIEQINLNKFKRIKITEYFSHNRKKVGVNNGGKLRNKYVEIKQHTTK